VIPLDAVLRRLAADLDDIGRHWALIGGFAVSARAEPRTTRDIDVAVAVADDEEAENVVLALRQRGYRDAGQVLEQQATGRLATMRLVSPTTAEGVAVAVAVVDVMFASTGIEPEIVAAATAIDVLPGTRVPVASLAHLLAMKVLAGRMQDVADVGSLLHYASADDLAQARAALALITERGAHRKKELAADFDRLCALARREGPQSGT
jgi:hypothetical protein